MTRKMIAKYCKIVYGVKQDNVSHTTWTCLNKFCRQTHCLARSKAFLHTLLLEVNRNTCIILVGWSLQCYVSHLVGYV